MCRNLVQRLEPAVVHVRSRDRDISERGHGEFAFVAVLSRRLVATKVFECCIESVVGEALALEQRTAVAMKTVRAKLFAARIIFGVKQLKAALLVVGELRRPGKHAVEFRVMRNLSEKELLQRPGDAVGGDFWSAESAGEECGVVSGTDALWRVLVDRQVSPAIQLRHDVR